MTKSYRFTAALATLALAAGGTTAFADSGNGAASQTNEGHGGTALRALGTPLPGPCLAPAVLLNPATAGGVIATGNYIAATGA